MNSLAIIPCHNESVSIAKTINSIKQVLPSAVIWVIDNASSDETARIARNCGATVFYEPQLGKGFAIRKAFSMVNSSFSSVFMVDGDDTYGIEEAKKGIELVENFGYDMVVGNRITSSTKFSKAREPYRPGHKFGNWIISRVLKLFFGLPIEDSLSGWRIMSVGFVKSFVGGASGFEIETELNVHAFTLNASVASLDVQYRGRSIGSNSKLRTYRDGIKILSKQISLLRHERPLYFYSALSIPWFVWSVFLLENVLQNYFSFREIPNFPSLIASVSFLLLGVLMLATGVILDHLRILKASQASLVYNLSKVQGDL